MASLNRCDFIGNCGRDPETRYTKGGTAVTRVSIACNEKWKDRDSGETKEHTEWVNLEFWGRPAEIAAEYLKKGDPVYVSGSLRTDKWTDRESGQEKYMTKVRVRDFQLLSGGGARKPRAQPKDYEEAKNGEPKYSPPPQQEFDDDIPF